VTGEAQRTAANRRTDSKRSAAVCATVFSGWLGRHRWMAASELDASASSNHLVGSQQDRLRDGQTESFGGLQIDDEFEFCWLLDR
jgi:hypothetical protein